MFCPNCGTENIAGARFCRSCGNALTAQTPSPFGETAVAAPEYMGFWIRLVAYLIDGVLVGIVNFAISAILGRDSGAQVVGSLVGIAISWLYFAYMWSSPRQASLGMMALGMQVTDLEGRQLSFGKATGRYFVQFGLALLVGIGFIVGALFVAFDSRKQALWDKAVGTFVVKKR